MNDDVARHLAPSAFRACRELDTALELLKQELPDDAYREHARSIAGAVHAVITALVDRPLAGRPYLRAEIDASIDRYGRYL